MGLRGCRVYRPLALKTSAGGASVGVASSGASIGERKGERERGNR